MQTTQSRMDTIGASEVSALFDCNPYESRYSLWCKKCGLTPPEDFNSHTTRQQVGLDLEEPILRIWGKRKGFHIQYNTESQRREDLPGLSATPDGFVWPSPSVAATRETGDVKTVRPHERKTYLAGIPRHHYWQQQQQTLVCRAKRGHLICLFGVDEIDSTVVEADENAHWEIIDAANVFWKQVHGDLPPPTIDEHRATLEALMHRQRETVTIDFGDPRVAEMMAVMDVEYQEAQSELREAKKRDRKAKSALLDALGSADCGTFANGSGYRVQRIGGKKPHNRLVRFTGENTEEGSDDE